MLPYGMRVQTTIINVACNKSSWSNVMWISSRLAILSLARYDCMESRIPICFKYLRYQLNGSKHFFSIMDEDCVRESPPPNTASNI